MGKRFLFTIGMLVFIGVAATAAVLLAKGYSFSSKQGALVGTGIISVSSVPDGASVYLDGHLTTATNTNISNLQPKTYSVKIAKDGFISWEKNIEVKEGVVSEVKATLFPALPTIYPLTFGGATAPALSPDGQKLAFAVPFSAETRSRQKGGIWVWTMTSQPIALARSGEPHQLLISSSDLDFSKATFRFSPDSTQVLVNMKNGNSESNYLLPVDRLTNQADLRDVTANLAGTLKEWDTDQKSKENARILTIKNLQVRQIASNSSQLVVGSSQPTNNKQRTTDQLKWSPDETKFIVILGSGATPESGKKDSGPIRQAQGPEYIAGQAGMTSAKVYDLVMDKSYDLPEAKTYLWLPDSKHVILVDDEKVAIADFDGTNVAVIYAGKFEDSDIFPWPDYSKLVILTSFNTPTASTPNLFGINLK